MIERVRWYVRHVRLFARELARTWLANPYTGAEPRLRFEGPERFEACCPVCSRTVSGLRSRGEPFWVRCHVCHVSMVRADDGEEASGS